MCTHVNKIANARHHHRLTHNAACRQIGAAQDLQLLAKECVHLSEKTGEGETVKINKKIK